MALAVFFAGACAGSWTCWIVAAALVPSAPQVSQTLNLVGSYGPALAALLVTAREAAPGRRRNAKSTAAAVVVLAVSAWVLSLSWHSGPDADQASWALVVLLGVAILPAAVTWLFMALTRDADDPDTMSPGVAGAPSRGSWFLWIALALALFPTLSVLGATVVGLVSGAGATLTGGTAWPSDAPALLGVFAATALYGGPLGEEPGWRTFALPRLQTRLSPVLASVVVGLGWAAWHLPLQLQGAYEPSMAPQLAGIITRFLSQVAVSVIFTWLFNHSGGSLLVVVVLHTSLNNTAGYWLPNNIGFQVAVGLLASLLVLLERTGLRRPPDAWECAARRSADVAAHHE